MRLSKKFKKSKAPEWHQSLGKIAPAAKKADHWPPSLYDIPFGQSNGRETYMKVHCAISRDQFEDNSLNGIYKPVPENHNLIEFSRMHNKEPKPEEFLGRLQRVGEQYGWDRRNHFQNIKQVKGFMKHPDTRIWALVVDGHEVGFGISKGLERSGQGFEKQKAVNLFLDKHDMPQNSSFIEFFKFGLYPEYTNKGWGGPFFTSILANLLRDHDVVYFDTRDNNHAGVLKFYENLKIDAFYAEELKSDLVKKAPNWKPKNYMDQSNFIQFNRGQHLDLSG
ncbi:MAG: hypothetical protein AAF182_01505 [Pseudomonadota bacterium]